MSRRILTSLMFLLLLASPALAAEKIRWLHVRVVDGGPDGETVHVNVPLALIDGILPLLEEKQKEHGGTFRLNDEDVDRAELQRILSQLRDMPEEAEVVLEKDGEKAWFSRKGDRLLIRTEDDGADESETAAGSAGANQPERKSETRIVMPMKLAEALLASEEMNLKQAIQSFEEDGEILVVDGSDNTTVRVWIDNTSKSE